MKQNIHELFLITFPIISLIGLPIINYYLIEQIKYGHNFITSLYFYIILIYFILLILIFKNIFKNLRSIKPYSIFIGFFISMIFFIYTIFPMNFLSFPTHFYQIYFYDFLSLLYLNLFILSIYIILILLFYSKKDMY